MHPRIQSYLHLLDPFPPPQTIPFREAVRVLRSPILGGVLVGFFVIAYFWPAGFDAHYYYLRWPPANATTPYWVYLLTYPLSWLGWPLSWQVLNTITVIAVSVIYAMRGNHKWWIVVFSTPMLFNAWWGQIEVLSLIGLILGLLILQKKAHPAWMGIAWLLLGIKIQTNYGLILLFTYWLWRQQGTKAILLSILSGGSIIGLTLIIWADWPAQLISVYGATQFGYSNASLWPFGLIAWPLALIPLPMDPIRRLRMIAAASLLGSPYFTLHHCLILMVLSDFPWLLLISWLPIVMIFQTRDWAMYAWIIPMAVLVFELYITAHLTFHTPPPTHPHTTTPNPPAPTSPPAASQLPPGPA